MKFAPKSGKPYIIPTLYGIAYFFLILNVFALAYYRNSAPFHTVGLTLSILGLVAMIQTNGSTRGLSVACEALAAGPAGGSSELKVRLRGDGQSEGYFNLELEAEKAYAHSGPTLIPYFQQAQGTSLFLHCGKRGIYPLRSIKVSSRGLFGLFYSWTWLNLEAEWVVYPAPDGHLPLPLQSEEGQSAVTRAVVGEDFHGHRPHQPGSPLRNIDWKAYARSQKLLLKDFQQEDESAVHLSFKTLPPMPLEAKLGQLSAWVFLCMDQNRPFSLDLEHASLAEGSGLEQAEAALKALAAYEEPS